MILPTTPTPGAERIAAQLQALRPEERVAAATRLARELGEQVRGTTKQIAEREMLVSLLDRMGLDVVPIEAAFNQGLFGRSTTSTANPSREAPARHAPESRFDNAATKVDDHAGRTPGRSRATVLVDMCQEHAELFHAPDGTGYADVAVSGHRETWALSSRGLRGWLEQRYFADFGAAPGRDAISDAITTLSGLARFNGPVRAVAVRVASLDGVLYLDLGTPDWSVVRVTASGWDVVGDTPVRFRRGASLRPLPFPTRGGSVGALRRLVQLDDDAYRLVVAWLVAVLFGRHPFPVLVLGGEQGSGKSVACRILRRLVDPVSVDLRSPPKTERDLVVAARNQYVVAFDNVSTIAAELSDALCRLATGGGFGTRGLYTDDEEVLFEETRPVLCNGIGALIERPDLADRAIFINLPVLADDRRRTEVELWREFDAIHAGVLGALLDAVAGALRDLPTIRLPAPPRMADFATIAVAAEPTLGWEPGAFLRSYTGNRTEAVEVSLESDLVAQAVRALVGASGGAWSGSSSELLQQLTPHASDTMRATSAWPKTPAALGTRLTRLAPMLRATGIDVERERSGRGRTTRLARRDSPVTAVTPVTGSVGPPVQRDGGSDGRTGALASPSRESPGCVADDGNDGVRDGGGGGTFGGLDDADRALIGYGGGS